MEGHYHVEALEAEIHCNSGRETIINTGTNNQVLGVLEHPVQLGCSRDDIEIDSRLLPITIDLIVSILFNGDSDSHCDARRQVVV